MRNVSRFLMVFFSLLAITAEGLAQIPNAATGSDEIRRYESLLQQPAAINSGAEWWKLAALYQNAARYADAERAYTKAGALLGSSDPTTRANLMDQMGTMYVEMGRYDVAEQLEQRALALRQSQKDPLGIGVSWMHLAMLSLGKHRNADGEMYAELAVERLVPERTAQADEHAATPEQKMTALIYLSLARCAAHNCAGALAPLKKAMTIAEANYPKRSFPVAYISFIEGYAEWRRGDNRSAARLMQSGTEGMEAQLGWGHPTYVSALCKYETFLAQSGHQAEAAAVRQKLERISGPRPAAQSARAERVPALP
jgi:tetratricopeptide (TPR) repeat protein